MRAFLTSKEMAKIDLKTMKSLSCSSYELMNLVAAEMADVLLKRFSGQPRVHILAGPGNNGGDAYCLARILKKKSWRLSVESVFQPESKDCRRAFKELKMKSSTPRFDSYDIIIDAVFGSGGRASLDQKLRERIRWANQSKAFRVALDVPTGCHSDTGKAHREAFRADLSLCVSNPKWGFLFESAAEFLGELEFVGRDFVKATSSKAFALEESDFGFLKQKKTAYKRGRCAIIAGSAKTPGAAFLAAESAHRTGVGYVTLIKPKKEIWNIRLKQASFLFQDSLKKSDLKKFDSLVLGCGGAPRSLSFLKNLKAPQVLDAEAIGPASKVKSSAQQIFTPHPGEAARFLKTTPQEIQSDRLGALEAISQRLNQAVYLKGAPGILKLAESKAYYVNLSANPVFARAGSGDVLAGILGGFLAQSPTKFREAVFSSLVFQKNIGEVLRSKRATIASDQLEIFSKAFERIRERA
ncbi:MAG: NAD(P)H-hydrate epimerase [Bdellovibrionota bacterium]